jgi:hypothetical protein
MLKTFEVLSWLCDNTPELRSPKDGTCRWRMRRREAEAKENDSEYKACLTSIINALLD